MGYIPYTHLICDHRKTNLIEANAVDRARDVDDPRVDAGYSVLLEAVESV